MWPAVKLRSYCTYSLFLSLPLNTMLSQVLKLFKNLIFIGQKFFYMNVPKFFNPTPCSWILFSPPSFQLVFLEGQLLSQRMNGSWFGGLASSEHIPPPSCTCRYWTVNNPAPLTAWVLDVILALPMRWRLWCDSSWMVCVWGERGSAGGRECPFYQQGSGQRWPGFGAMS